MKSNRYGHLRTIDRRSLHCSTLLPGYDDDDGEDDDLTLANFPEIQPVFTKQPTKKAY